MILAQDNFNRADGNLHGSSLSGGTYIWDVISGSWAIATNKAVSGGTTTYEVGVLNPDPALQDCYVQATILQTQATGQGVVARVANVDNLYWAAHRAVEGKTDLVKRVAGVNTQIGMWAGTPASGDVIRLECSGINPGSLSVYVAGILRIGPVNGDNVLDSGNMGILGLIEANNWSDNFEADDLAAGGFVPYPFSRGAHGGLHRLTGGLA